LLKNKKNIAHISSPLGVWKKTYTFGICGTKLI